MRVDIEEFDKYSNYMSKINRCPLEELELYRNNIKINISKKDKDDFSFIGLNNKDFINMYGFRKE